MQSIELNAKSLHLDYISLVIMIYPQYLSGKKHWSFVGTYFSERIYSNTSYYIFMGHL